MKCVTQTDMLRAGDADDFVSEPFGSAGVYRRYEEFIRVIFISVLGGLE